MIIYKYDMIGAANSIGVNPAGDTGDVSPTRGTCPPENWTAGDGIALCPPKCSF